MNPLNRDQWTAVDERFDKEFTCVVTYEKWPDEEEQRLREPQYKFKDFPNTNPKIIKNFLHSELEKVRQETEKRHQREMEEARIKTLDMVLEGLPKKKVLESGWDGSYSGNLRADGFNEALDQISQSINKQK